MVFLSSDYVENDSASMPISDYISCIISEEINGSYSISLSIPISSYFANKIVPGKYISADVTPYDDPKEKKRQLFYITDVSSDERSGSLTAKGYHISVLLELILINSFNATDVYDFCRKFNDIMQYRARFVIHPDFDANYAYTPKSKAPMNAREMLFSRSNISFVSLFGGEAEINNYDIYFHPRRGTDRKVKAVYGKNLEKIKVSRTSYNSIGSVYPYYESGETYVELPEKRIFISNEESIGRQRDEKLNLTGSFDDVPTADQLRKKANDWISINVKPGTTEQIDLAFSDQDLETRIGDDIFVSCPLLGVEKSYRVIKTTFDCKENRYVNLTLGKRVPDLPGTLIKMIEGV